MPYETFAALLARHVEANGIPDTVSLQGEGEPTLHHDFFRMAEHVTNLGANRNSRPHPRNVYAANNALVADFIDDLLSDQRFGTSIAEIVAIES
jgi:hypothetical protein